MKLIIDYIKAALMIISVVASTLIFATLTVSSYYLTFFLPRQTRSKVAHFFAGLWGKFIIIGTPGWTVKVEGKENLSRNKRYVFVSNHESATDIFVMYFTNLQFRWLSKASVFKVPLIGWAMKCSGYIPIERGNKKSHIDALTRSQEVVESGVPMLYFPEGTRSKTGDLNPFKIGAFKLAEETGAEIVPITLVGTKELLQKGSFMPGSANVKVKILAPISKLESESLEQYASRARDIILAARSN